jgi:hypothetical protein
MAAAEREGGEMVTPEGVPVEEEPIDVIGGQPAEAMRVGEDLINPAGGRPFGTSLGEALRAAQKPSEPPGGPEGPSGGAGVVTPPAVPAVPEPAVEYVDERLQDEDYRGGLEQMSGELTPGGGITLVPDTEGGRIDPADATAFTRRTKSTNPGWFQSVASEEGVSVKQVWNAVEKALAGKRLGVRQKRVIEGMLDELQGQQEQAEAEFAKQQAFDAAERAEDVAEREAIQAEGMGDLEAARPLAELAEAEIPFEPITEAERKAAKAKRKAVEPATTPELEKFRHEEMEVPEGSIIDEARKATEQPTEPDKKEEIVEQFLTGFYGKGFTESTQRTHWLQNPTTTVAGEPGASRTDRKATHLANRGADVIVDAYNDAQSGVQPAEKYIKEFRNAIAHAKEKGGWKEGMLGSRHDYLEARWFFEKGKKREVSWENVSAVAKALGIDLEPTAALEFEEEAIDQQALLEEIVAELRGKGPGFRNSMFFDETEETFEMADFEDALIEDGWETDPIGSELGAVYTNPAEQSVAIQEHDTEGQYTIHWYAGGEEVEQAEVPADQGLSGDLFSEGAAQMDIEEQAGKPELDTLADNAEQAIIDLPDDAPATSTERNMIMGDIRRLKINKHPRADEVAQLMEQRLDGWSYKIVREYPNGERDVEVTFKDDTTAVSLKKGEPLHKAVDLIADVEEETVLGPAGLPVGRVIEGKTTSMPELAARELEKNYATKKLTPIQRAALRVATRMALDSENADSSFPASSKGKNIPSFMAHVVDTPTEVRVSTSKQKYTGGSITVNTVQQLINKGVMIPVDPNDIMGLMRVPNIPEVVPTEDASVLSAEQQKAIDKLREGDNLELVMSEEADVILYASKEDRKIVFDIMQNYETVAVFKDYESAYAEFQKRAAEMDALPSEAEIDTAANEAATSPENALPEPTDEQKKAGNYKKGHLLIAGLDVSIENPVGSVRFGRMKMKDHYGYIKRTEGKDGDQVDVFVNPKAAEDFAGTVYIVDQRVDGKAKGGFDEHKVMLGYKSKLDAIRAYRRNYTKGWVVGPVAEMDLVQFKAWLAEPGANKQEASKSKVFEANKKLFKKAQKDRHYSLGKDYFNAPNKKWLDTVLGDATRIGDIPDTMPINELVSQLTRLQDTRALPHSQVPVLERATQDRVTQEVARINEAFPGAKIRLVSYDEVRNTELEAAIEKDFGEKLERITVPAIYRMDRDEIYIFKERVSTVRQTRKLAMHEMFHKGFSRLGIKDVDAFLDDFYENMPGEHKIRLKEIMVTYGLDETVAEDRREGAEEVLASLAETEPNHSWVRKFVAAVRNLLEKAGIITPTETWTDAEISALIAEAHGSLARTRDKLGGVTLDEDVTIEDTGEVFTVQESAAEIISQHDKRKNAVQKLKACLGR